MNVQKYAVKQSGNDGIDRKYEGEKAEVATNEITRCLHVLLSCQIQLIFRLSPLASVGSVSHR